MSGTYSITENRSDAHKFKAMVSFNHKAPEYHEVDYSYDEEGKLDTAAIATSLQVTADSDAASSTQSPAIEIDANGQLIL